MAYKRAKVRVNPDPVDVALGRLWTFGLRVRLGLGLTLNTNPNPNP